ncbi:hypothetical protein SD427_11260 [Chryseobacterium sp. JJR-5R]|uniref:hypothetical protein n=1 Tax=Chryseobacterium sp. JJR-5R TaxID=3093923 RepID=UPI002A761614|nr:hypothetical protein [Chryseobacterium sp. JJR-5R]WPO81341.1 hypothetical protein SD427_11260 [Chryseobacterium sp. JJR-5R]
MNNNKKFSVVTLLFIWMHCCSQVYYNSWINGYMSIASYGGNTIPDAYTANFTANGYINVPYWRLSVRLTQPVTSTDGNYTLPANKISFTPVSTSGSAYPFAVPSVSQIGMPLNVMMQEGPEVFLVPQSNAALYNFPFLFIGYYYNLQIKYSLMVAGGSYLGNYPAWTTFVAPMQFTAYDRYNNVIGRMDHVFQFQIGMLSGTPPDVPEMSLKFSANAVNSSLEFKSKNDYTNGVSSVYANALSVKSNTNYQIKIRSLQSKFTSPAGNSLPLEAVKFGLSPVSGNNATVYPIVLASFQQLVAKGAYTQGSSVYYDINYSTSPNDQRFINAKTEDYSTTLQFEITPQ